MPGPGSDQSLGAQLGRECIGGALQEGGVVAGSDERRDAGLPKDVEPWARLSRRSAAVGAANGVDDVLGKRPVDRNGRAGYPQELAQPRGIGVEAVGQDLVADELKALSSASSGRRWKSGGSIRVSDRTCAGRRAAANSAPSAP